MGELVVVDDVVGVIGVVVDVVVGVVVGVVIVVDDDIGVGVVANGAVGGVVVGAVLVVGGGGDGAGIFRFGPVAIFSVFVPRHKVLMACDVHAGRRGVSVVVS